MRILDVVRLLQDYTEDSITVPANSYGTIVEIFDGPPPIFEVEFADECGRTILLATLREDQIEGTRYGIQ